MTRKPFVGLMAAATAALALATPVSAQTVLEGVVGTVSDDGVSLTVVPKRWDWNPAGQVPLWLSPATRTLDERGRAAPPQALQIGTLIRVTLDPASGRADMIAILPFPPTSEDDIAAAF